MNNKLNELMAEKAMEWGEDNGLYVLLKPLSKMGESVMPVKDWNPTDNIAQAMRCAAKYCEDNDMTCNTNYMAGNDHSCQIYTEPVAGNDCVHEKYFEGYGVSAEQAICECIAVAVGGEG